MEATWYDQNVQPP